jgi:hypothetical protein
VLRLIESILKAGCYAQGKQLPTECGTPQGGVISPLLSNILLTPFDCEMRKEGYRLTRYADDCAPRRCRKEAIMVNWNVPCCTGDEGRPLEAAMQVEASNYLKLLWSKAMVVSVKEKVLQDRIKYVPWRRTPVNRW